MASGYSASTRGNHQRSGPENMNNLCGCSMVARWPFLVAVWVLPAILPAGSHPINRDVCMVTSNHIHLLVVDDGDRDMIARSIQLVAGRPGQEYNQRKARKGAFWEDRYHATAVEGGDHLFRCLVYIDLNMVRVGIVDHPLQWLFCGYNEIRNPKRKNVLISS